MNKVVKTTLYPKTKRIGSSLYQVVEKLDGSNIGFFKLNGSLIVAQRNNLYAIDDIDNIEDLDKSIMYKGLLEFLSKNGVDLLNSLNESSGFFAEWIGMGQIKYGESLPRKAYIFAKANIKLNDLGEYEVYNLYWDRSLLIYPFINQEIPAYIGQPALIAEVEDVSIESLNVLYDNYVDKVDRPVEGFVIMSQNGGITKYVRNKRGKLTPHELPR